MVILPVQFKHQSVRDLAWAISSPPLVAQMLPSCIWPQSKWYWQIYQEALPWLKQVDSDPAQLDELLASQKDRRLGKYFETLWFHWLDQHKRYQVIESNLQIIIDGQTLGEIDFIVFDKTTKQVLHWELAVKFYLGVGDTREMSNWLGPNCRDRLDLKVQHLMHRQSLISQNKAVTQWLKQQGIVIDQCAVILKGRLYYPWHLQQNRVAINAYSPPNCAPDHEHGWWFKQSQFDQAFAEKDRFLPLINKGWLARISTAAGREMTSKSRIYETLSKNKFRLPLQLQLCNTCCDWDRVFLVGDSWPEKNP